MPGVDCTVGLRRAGGKPALYRKLLETFVRDMAGSVDAVQSALAEGHRSAAVRAAHSLKGSAGTIGAGAVAAAAGELEARLAAGQDPDPLALAMLAAELAAVVAGIDRALAAMPTDTVTSAPAGTETLPGSESAARSSAPAEAALDPALLNRLESLLANDDTAAGGLIDSHEAALAAHLGAARFGALRDAIENYDFEAALAVMRNAKP